MPLFYLGMAENYYCRQSSKQPQIIQYQIKYIHIKHLPGITLFFGGRGAVLGYPHLDIIFRYLKWIKIMFIITLPIYICMNGSL